MSAEPPEGRSIDSQGVSQAQSLSAEESSFMPGLGSAVCSRWKGWGPAGHWPQRTVGLGNVRTGWREEPRPRREFQLWRFRENVLLFALADPTHVRTTAAKEKSQIQSLTPPLMWALRRFRGTRQALFRGETCQECWCAPCCDWRLLV